MGFTRIKIIKGKKYAYIVENKWTKNGPRQKTKQYLGRVYSPLKKCEIKFYEYFKEYNINERSFKEIIKDLTKIELLNHDFKLNNNGLWINNDCIVDLKKLRFFNQKNKNIVLNINEGLLCKTLISKIIKLTNPQKEEPEKEGYILAKLLVESGLKVEPDIFIKLYELSKN